MKSLLLLLIYTFSSNRTYNVWGDNLWPSRKEALCTNLQTIRSDIMLLQEGNKYLSNFSIYFFNLVIFSNISISKS